MEPQQTIGTVLKKIKSGLEAEDLVIGGLTSIGAVGGEAEEIDTTTLDSTGGYKEFIMGAKDAGETAIAGIIKSNDMMEAMNALFNSQAKESYEIIAENGDKWEIDAFVKAFKESEKAVGGVRSFEGTLRISGAPVYTPAEVSA